MALTYSQLVADKSVDGSLKNWLNYALLPVDTILTQAQAFIYERLRAREMRTETAVTFAIDDDSMDLPDGFLDPVQLLLDGDSDPIAYVHENMLGRLRDEDGLLTEGVFTRYAIIDEQMKFDVRTTDARTGYLWYYGTPPPLAPTTNEANFLTRRYPNLLLAACEAFGFQFRRMPVERDSAFKVVFEGVNAANAAADDGRRGQTMR